MAILHPKSFSICWYYHWVGFCAENIFNYRSLKLGDKASLPACSFCLSFLVNFLIKCVTILLTLWTRNMSEICISLYERNNIFSSLITYIRCKKGQMKITQTDDSFWRAWYGSWIIKITLLVASTMCLLKTNKLGHLAKVNSTLDLQPSFKLI